MPRNAVSFDEVMAADGEEDASERLFELANASHVRFRVPSASAALELCIRQDPSNETTGGCIWETSYLLSQWAIQQLENQLRARRPLRCLEVGAGCGLFGLSLAAVGANVVLTETTSAMPNLEYNVEHNPPPPGLGGSTAVVPLTWGDASHVTAARALGPFDLICGTDVVYVVALVSPLLETLWTCATASTTVTATVL